MGTLKKAEINKLLGKYIRNRNHHHHNTNSTIRMEHDWKAREGEKGHKMLLILKHTRRRNRKRDGVEWEGKRELYAQTQE